MASRRNRIEQSHRHGRTHRHPVPKRRVEEVPVQVRVVAHEAGRKIIFSDETEVFHAVEGRADIEERDARTRADVNRFRKRFAFAGPSLATARTAA
jgi:hypothetical protein